MDARPQRPIRSLKIFDENAIHPTVGQKTIHQRNKSSPALSTMAHAGALKAAAKRTAFGDLSNTANTLRTSRDDSAMVGKNNQKLKENLPPLRENKQTTFQKPAQRPLTIGGLKNLIGTNTSNQVTVKQPLNDVKAPTIQPAINKPTIARRLSTKRSTAVFKDVTAATEVIQPKAQIKEAHEEIQDIKPVAPVHRALPPLPAPEEPSTGGVLHKLLQEGHGDRQDQLVESFEALAPPNQQVETIAMPQEEQGKVKPKTSLLHVHPEAGWKSGQESDAIPTTTNIHLAKSMPLADITNVKPTAHLEPSKARKLPPVSEPEEYWEEEEPIDNYEEDGYVTARSFKSRGDNTTGGATTILFPKQTQKAHREVALAKELIEGSKTIEELEDEAWDTTMVAEYSDDIFQYMRELEIKMLPNAHYMDNQAEIQWSMRAVLVDWIVQVHHRFNLLPETLFLTVNYIDRFLSAKIVSLGKLQLVGATAIFIAAKYEEIDCPSIHEIAFMVDGGYTIDEILKAERFMLTMLQFELGWPGPMSFLRRISKADDYDLETRTLAKYFLEITIMDERFVGSPPSFVAAGAHCLARMMLRKGSWSPAHVYYSEYTYTTLFPLILLMVECCENAQLHHAAIYDKYTDKRFKRASIFAEMEMRKGFQPLPISHSLPLGSQMIFSNAWELPLGEISGQA